MTTDEKKMYLHDSLEWLESLASFINSELNTAPDFVMERGSDLEWLRYNVNRIECLTVEIQNKIARWIKEGYNSNTPAENETSNCRELGS